MISFEEFKKSTYQDWEQITIKTLKGKDLHETLDWELNKGVNSLSFYDSSFASESQYITHFFKSFKRNPWKLYEEISYEGGANSNESILNALQNGCDGIIINTDTDIQVEDMALLLKNVLTDICDISFKGGGSATSFNSFQEYLASSAKKSQGGLVFQANSIKSATHTTQQIIDEEPADIVAGSALQLHQLIEILKTEKSDFTKKLFFEVIPSDNFYANIIRLRALRFLATAIAKDAGIEINPADIKIHVRTTAGSDYKENMLQNTSTGLASVLGGATSVSFDIGSEKGKSFAKRISRNIGNLLREESKMVFEDDPVAGSYFLDYQTHKTCEAIWQNIGKS